MCAVRDIQRAFVVTLVKMRSNERKNEKKDF